MSFNITVIIEEVDNEKSSYNAIIKINGSNHKILQANDDIEGWTQDITPITNLVHEKRRYQFYDTLGMNEVNKELNKKIKNNLGKEVANKNNRIKCILFWIFGTIYRIIKSLKDIKEE